MKAVEGGLFARMVSRTTGATFVAPIAKTQINANECELNEDTQKLAGAHCVDTSKSGPDAECPCAASQ